MHLLCIGINHNTAPLNLREELSFSEEEIRTALQQWKENPQAANSEVLILSTCNRTEIYGAFPSLTFQPFESLLLSERGKESQMFLPHLYLYTDDQVVRHLMRVASGLDSQVVGETQILGQVQRALDIALTENSVSALLIRLFQSAIHAGKRAHTETKISQKPISLATLAVELALQSGESAPQESSVLVLGAGEMAESALEALRVHPVRDVIIINRTLAKAQQLARRWGYKYGPLSELNDALLKVDLVLSALNVSQSFLTYTQIARIMHQRNGKTLKLVDMGVPHNIDPRVAQLSGVLFWDLDHLKHQAEEFILQQQAEIAHVEEILEEEQQRFFSYLKRRKITPVLSEIQQHAEQVRMAELEKTLRRLPGLNAQQQKRIEAFSEALVKKILAYPFIRVINAIENPPPQSYLELVQESFVDLYDQTLSKEQEDQVRKSMIFAQIDQDQQS